MFKDFLSILFPETCRLCHSNLGKNEPYLCLSCQARLPVIDLVNEMPELHHFFYESFRYTQIFSLLKFTKQGITQQLLHQIKYKRQPQLATWAGEALGLNIMQMKENFPIEMILPIPLHPKKKRKRGFNQSEYFAIGLSNIMQVPTDFHSLIRQINNPTQTKRSRIKRLENVEGIFSLSHANHLKDKHILLVDDVITTGATLYACTMEMLRAGVGQVSVATIAVAK